MAKASRTVGVLTVVCGTMNTSFVPRLLPEEDAVEDPDDEVDLDLSLPGDLWFSWGERWNGHRILADGQAGSESGSPAPQTR